MFRRAATLVVGILPAVPGKNLLLRSLGHKVAGTARLAPSVLLVERLYLDGNAEIGWLNYVNCRRVVLRKRASLGRFNSIRGPLSLWLGEESGIGHGNSLRRAPAPTTYGPSQFRLGDKSKATVGHFFDCTRNISFGRNVVIAGRASQFWTHGYYHLPDGTGRFRVDGAIDVEDDVYIGSMVLFSYGARVEKGSVIGANVVVAKALDRGLYVNQPLRKLPSDAEALRARLRRVDLPGLAEPVYEKRDID